MLRYLLYLLSKFRNYIDLIMCLRGGGGAHPDLFVKLVFEIAVVHCPVNLDSF